MTRSVAAAAASVEVDGLWIYVGMQWRDWHKDWWQDLSEAEQQAWRERPTHERRDPYRREYQTPFDAVKAGAHPAAHLAGGADGVDGVENVVQSGAFTASGSVYYDPARAFAPEAKVPEGEAEAFERNLSFERFDYTYSEDQP